MCITKKFQLLFLIFNITKKFHLIFLRWFENAIRVFQKIKLLNIYEAQKL